MPDGSTDVLSTIRPGVMERYSWGNPIGAFIWPMNTMTRRPEIENMNYDELVAYFRGTGRYWWICRIYKSYTGLLDMYIMFEDSVRVYHYILDYDMEHVTVGEGYGGYPQPPHFYLARNAILTSQSWTIQEYNAIATIQRAPAPIQAAPVPDADANEEAAMNLLAEVATDIATESPIVQGGAVVLPDCFLFSF